MTRWLVGLLFFSGGALAEPSLYSVLATDKYPSPMSLMLELEREQPGVISEFEMDLDHGELIYEFKMIDTQGSRVTEYEYLARDGSLLEKDSERLDLEDEKEELAALQALEQAQMYFSDVVRMASRESSGYLIKAEVDNDLGISYLELEFLEEYGKRKLAFDIKNQQLLPLIKWD